MGAGSGEGVGSLTDIHGYKGGLEDAPEGFDCRGELLDFPTMLLSILDETRGLLASPVNVT